MLYVFPVLSEFPLDELTAPLVIDALKPVELNGNLDTVRRVCQRINEIMVFATNTSGVSQSFSGY